MAGCPRQGTSPGKEPGLAYGSRMERDRGKRGMDWGAIGAPGSPRQVGVTSGLCGLAARLGG